MTKLKVKYIKSTYYPIYSYDQLLGGLRVHGWLPPALVNKVWFEDQMLIRYGKDWDKEDE